MLGEGVVEGEPANVNGVTILLLHFQLGLGRGRGGGTGTGTLAGPGAKIRDRTPSS